MRRTGIALLVALSLLVAGCDGQAPVVTRIVAGASEPPEASATPQPSATPSASPAAGPRKGRHLSAEEARAALPDEAALPGTGWEAPPSTDDPATPTKPADCGQVGRRGPLVQQAEPDVLETVTYRTKEPQDMDAKFFIASWSNAADGFDVDKAAALAERCRTFAAYDGAGKSYPVTVDRLTPPPIGETQFAVRLTVAGDGYLTIVWARVGHNMVQLSLIHEKAGVQVTPFRAVLEAMVEEVAVGS